MNKYVIFGDTSFAERLYKYITIENRDAVIAFTQEQKYISKNELCDLPVIPFENLKEKFNFCFSIIIALGYSQMNAIREKVYYLCKKNNFQIGTYISKNAIIYCEATEVREGCFICPGVVIGTDCSLGVCNIIESSVVLSHDNCLGNFNYISSSAVIGGNTTIGNNCFIGLNSTIKDSLILPDKTLVGAGSNLISLYNYTNEQRGGGVRRKPCSQIGKREYQNKNIGIVVKDFFLPQIA